MNKLLASCFAATLTAALVHAGPADDAAAAAKKVAAAANYSWTATTEIANSQFPAMPVNGVTEKGGYTVITREFNGNAMQTVRKGEQVVSQNMEGAWMTMEEMRQQFANRGGGGGGQGAGGGNRGGGAGGGGGRGFGGFGFGGGGQNNPAEDAANLAAKIKDAKLVDGAIAGTLSAEDAAPMLSFGGRGGRGGAGGGTPPPAPKNVSASVKFWVKDGVLTKYVLNVKGTIATPNGDEREIDRTTTTEFKDIGSTKVTVPEEAKKKLGA
ncbi:MAG: hypothetical protein HZA93_04780 [Verrucomicrobia bacterium]|nr:hypothetical protein [Verrucomicrobiota bacterium]